MTKGAIKPLTVYLESVCVVGCTCLATWKGKISFCLCGLLAGCLAGTSHSGLTLLQKENCFFLRYLLCRGFSGLGIFVFNSIPPT